MHVVASPCRSFVKQVVINMHKVLVRFGIMHAVATNICCWLITTVVEANEDFRAISTHELMQQQQQQSTVEQHLDINGGSPHSDTVHYAIHMHTLS